MKCLRQIVFFNFTDKNVDSFVLQYLTYNKTNDDEVIENTLKLLNNEKLVEILPGLRKHDVLRYSIKIDSRYNELEKIDQKLLVEEKLSNLEKQLKVFSAKKWYNPFAKKAYECIEDYVGKLEKPAGFYIKSVGGEFFIGFGLATFPITPVGVILGIIGLSTEFTRRNGKKKYQKNLEKTQLFLDDLNKIEQNYNTIKENIEKVDIKVIPVDKAIEFVDEIVSVEKKTPYIDINYNKANEHLKGIYRNHLKEKVLV